MAKQKELAELKITVAFFPAPDHGERLRKVLNLLLSPASGELDSREKPPSTSANNNEDKEVFGAD
ncbi:hypothetical protein ACFLXA_01660 [Chloroflexota bacterium]